MSGKLRSTKKACTQIFIEVLFIIAKIGMQQRCSSVKKRLHINNCQKSRQWNIKFSSVTKSCPTLCNPMGIYLYPMDKDISSVQLLSCV